MNKALNKYTRNIGNIIMVTGVLHLIVGLVENWGAAVEIVQSGVINTVDETPERLGFFWFEISGLFVLLVGSLLQQYLNEYKKQIPRKYGFYLLIIAITGCILEPVSGFYIYIPISFLIIVTGNKSFRTGDTTDISELYK